MIKVNLSNPDYCIYSVGTIKSGVFNFNMALGNKYSDLVVILSNLGNMTWNTDNGYRKAITEKIIDMDKKHLFDKYIAQYEYELKCFDIGNSQLSGL